MSQKFILISSMQNCRECNEHSKYNKIRKIYKNHTTGVEELKVLVAANMKYPYNLLIYVQEKINYNL